MRINEIVLPPHPDKVDIKMFWNNKHRYFEMHKERDQAIQEYLQKVIEKKALIKLNKFSLGALTHAGILKKDYRRVGFTSEVFWIVVKDVKIRAERRTYSKGDEISSMSWDPN